MTRSAEAYEIRATLYESARTTVYRATRKHDGHPVIIKHLRPDVAGPQNLRRLQNEFELLQLLRDVPVAQVLACEDYAGSQALILEDEGGDSLAQVLKGRRLAPEAFIPLAIRLAEIVRELHRRNIVHRDLQPGNVLVVPPTQDFTGDGWDLRLIDFDVATRRPREEVQPHPPNQIDGSLPYLPPEQSGRMNRVVDFRADYYSLGVTFYQMLTGRLPFEAADTIGWLHCHVAMTPPKPEDIDPTIPEALSRIVMRLLAKNPEDRYQSGTGLIMDLEQCRRLDAGRGVSAGFIAGLSDMPEEVRMPQRLYGRDASIQRLGEAFERARSGTVELALVLGVAGVGKTALVHHVINLGADMPGYVLEGKFDQYQREVPYGAWIQAFNRLLQFWLSETPERLALWRERLMEGLGDSVGVLTAILPGAEWLLGKQPAPAGSAGETARHQFDYVLGRFIKVVAGARHPLIIFLDDLQWADDASLRLLRSVLEDPDLEYFAVVGAYRSDEVPGEHPLRTVTQALDEVGVRLVQLEIGGLAPEDVDTLLADALRSTPERVGGLAASMYGSSGGNPFALARLLETLRDEGVIRFDTGERCWNWDPALLRQSLDTRGRALQGDGDMLEGMAEPVREVLQVAACLGNRFDAATLASVLEQPERDIAATLNSAVEEALLLPVDGAFRFVHDRVRKSAYDSLGPAGQRRWHLRIGRILQAHGGQERLFDVVYQLNQAVDALEGDAPRRELALLNLEAARKARQGVAYAEARQFVRTTVGLLPARCWEEDGALAYDAHHELAELHYLNHDFEAAESVIRRLLKQPLSILERAQTLNLLITLNTMRAQYAEALESAREALALLDVRLPESEVPVACEALIERLLNNVAHKTADQLSSMPDMPPGERRMAVRILATLAPITYFVDQTLYPFVVGTVTDLSMQHGPTPDTAFGYASFGLILASRRQFASAYLFGEAAAELADRYPDPGQQCKALQIVANHVKLWGAPLHEADGLNERVYRLGLESGELQFAGYSRNNHVLNSFFMGMSLSRLDELIGEYLGFCRRTGNVIAEDTINSVRLPMLNLMGRTGAIDEFHEDSIGDSDLFIARCSEHNSNYAICSFWTHKAFVLYLYEDYEPARRCLEEAERYLLYMPASIAVVHWHLCRALVEAALATSGSGTLAEALSSDREELALLATQAPENFLHTRQLVDAEIARLRGDMWEAMTLYDRAIDTAEANGFFHHAALAHELAGRFWLSVQKRDQARCHFNAAHEGYRRWGAQRKANELRRRHLDLWLESGTERDRLLQESDAERLDWMALMKASHAMAEEIRMDRLMMTIMEVMVENAGAERGMLLLYHEGTWWVEAEGGSGQSGMLLNAEPLDGCSRIPHGIVYYVVRTGEDVVLGNAAQEGAFTKETFVSAQGLRSVLCTPLIHKGEVVGALYLENRLTAHAFSAERLMVLKVLAGQAAIALQNARLYGDLELRVRDRTRQLEQLNARLETLASTDHLTGVMNRRRFQEHIQLMLAHARRYDTWVAVLLFDIDHFKAVNDRFGHAMGDRVLQDIANRVQTVLRETDVFARWGGEEFIVLTEHADPQAAQSLAERLRVTIGRDAFGEVGTLTVSVGVACSRGRGTAEDMIGSADRALYEAKRAGRDRVSLSADFQSE